MNKQPSFRMPLKYAENTRKWCDCSLEPRPDISFCSEKCALVTGLGESYQKTAGASRRVSQ
jgi:hypothetical protein